MKNMKKKVVAIALVAALIAILSLGSLAYFSAKDEITNTIKLADNFKVEVYEHDWSKPNTDETTEGLTYTNIMPGQKIDKDPTVRNSGAHSEWVRVNVTIPNYDDVWSVVFADEETVDLTSIFGGFDSALWKRPGGGVPDPNEDGSITYTFYLTKVLNPGETATLFKTVTIPGGLTSEQAETLDGSFDLIVEAEAVQAEYLPITVTTAQEAFALLGD